MIKDMLNEERFDFISSADKQFIIKFTEELERLGYNSGNIGDGFCWGRYMIIYRKAGVKSETVYARIYIRDDGIRLRLFFNNVTGHAGYIDAAPDYIRSVFTGDYGKCKRCKGDTCKFRKTYTVGGAEYEKCNGLTFEFFDPISDKLPEYIKLFTEFFPVKNRL